MYDKNQLTQKQQEILEFLQNQYQRGSVPTYREIAKHFGFKSPSSALEHVHALEKKGYLNCHRRHARSIELLLENKPSVISVPILGDIPAGPPEKKIEVRGRTISVDPSNLGLPSGHRLFALVVKGDSMKERGIYDGDWVVADVDIQPKQGDVVVALIDGESTLKTLVRQKGKGSYYLKAENPKQNDRYPLLEIVIQGVVKAVIRRL